MLYFYDIYIIKKEINKVHVVTEWTDLRMSANQYIDSDLLGQIQNNFSPTANDAWMNKYSLTQPVSGTHKMNENHDQKEYQLEWEAKNRHLGGNCDLCNETGTVNYFCLVLFDVIYII